MPQDPAVGNDDASTYAEDNNPYAEQGKPTAVLDQSDTPRCGMANVAGQDGDTFELRWHFRDFVRLQIGDKWYRISDDAPWRVHFRFRKANGEWLNNGSNAAADDNGW